MPGRRSEEQERRKYIRLDSVFPVNFRILSLDGQQVLSDWIQGFTGNISRGGICLSVNNLKPAFAEIIKQKQVKLSLDIEMPLHKTPVSAKAIVAWMELVSKEADRYLIGLAYQEISPVLNKRIFRYALAKRFIPRLGLAVLLILFACFSVSSYLNLKLIRSNKALVDQFVNILQKSSIAKQEIKKLTQDKEELGLELSELEIRLKTLEKEKKNIAEAAKTDLIKDTEANTKIEELMKLTEQLEKEKLDLQNKLISLQSKESKITENLLLLDKRKAHLEKANFEKMYEWLKVHQNPRTGLVLSYEGDKQLEDWAFLYDQALVAIAFTNFSDFERARRILNFFKFEAKKQYAGFLNAYYAKDGEPAEFIVHSGPNIWLGIALLHYIKTSRDSSYLDLAKAIGDWVMDLQNQDRDAGIRGGPKVYWYATEHNLDAYALFNMLYKVIGDPKYDQAAQRTLNWLKLHVYDRPDIPIIRGKGDSTIATDTYAWSIAAIGPDKLEGMGMNPEQIIEFAEQTCLVEAEFIRQSGEKLRLKGFDFAPTRHVSRGGVISCEWTAQMVLAYKLMAKFYSKKELPVKARYYELKADGFLTHLCKFIISSPSPVGLGEGCLPYASQDFVDTGHGWSTPKGKSTGSVAATAYALFAYYGRNPLELPN